MTQDDIIRMAREAGWPSMVIDNLPGTVDETRLQRFAAIVAAAERQRLHDKFMEIHKSQQHSNNYWHFAARKIKEQE